MSKQTKTRYALLGVLSMGPASGYDIKKFMEKTTDHFWREGDSSIYPILKGLLHDGLVSCKVSNGKGEKIKKIYTITADGQQELNDWLKESPEEPQVKHELMLKIFFGWNANKEFTLEHILNRQRQLKLHLKNYKDLIQSFPNIPPKGQQLFQYLTIRSGMVHTEAALSWCDEAIKVLDNDN
jgi:PadR family transcriptional regulator AphA